MQSLLAIRVQKLFLVTIILKVLSSLVGWLFQLQWTFGFIIPLAFMAAYVVLGLKRQDQEVSDEKFADSCYYLGFIFTISSIILSLFDLPNIGTSDFTAEPFTLQLYNGRPPDPGFVRAVLTGPPWSWTLAELPDGATDWRETGKRPLGG